MAKRFPFVARLALLALLAGGCGSGEWVTIPMMGCQDIKELEKDPKNFEMAMGEYMGPSTCRDAGGLTYTGDYRCAGDKAEVRCEEG